MNPAYRAKRARSSLRLMLWTAGSHKKEHIVLAVTKILNNAQILPGAASSRASTFSSPHLFPFVRRTSGRALPVDPRLIDCFPIPIIWRRFIARNPPDSQACPGPFRCTGNARGRTPRRFKDRAGRLARSRQEEYVFGHATEPIITASPIGPLGG